MRSALKPIALAALLSSSAACAAPADAELAEQVKKLNERLEKLEKRPESRTDHAAGKVPADVEKRLQALEQSQQQIDKSLDSSTISEDEPELTSRLKAVERDALDMKKSATRVEALEGLAVRASLTTVAQRPDGLPADTLDGNSQLNYRADVTVELPLEPIGDVEQKLFTHFRLGQGLGLNTPFSNMNAFASAPNAVAFRASGANPDDSVAIMGQAWYQANIPLPFGGFKPRSRESLELTFGKMDMFGFFDQNAAAGDEGRQFLNSIFVHNPLLDAGGQAGVDANGFQPGFVASYYNKSSKPETWRLSLGIFGTHQGANYQRFFSAPLIMAQAEASLRLFDGLAGNYRLYTWRQGQGTQLDESVSQQAGWGISADQHVGDGITLFGRYGQMTKGQVPFDRAITLGSELNGSYWDRGGDVAGVAVGWMRSSEDYRAAGGTHDLLGNDAPNNAATVVDNINFSPNGQEMVLEIYYRYRISRQFELSPDFQYIWQLGADPDADNIKILGLRAQLMY